MREVICDIEANGLYKPTIIWCIVCKETDTGDVRVFKTQEDIHNNFASYIEQFDKVIGHNFLGYDLPVLNKLIKNCNLSYKKITDTLILSDMFNPAVKLFDEQTQRFYIGRKRTKHGLEEWGLTLGYPKQDFHEFDKYSEEMVTYCINDVELNYRVWQELCKENNGYNQEAIDLEHFSQYVLSRQQAHGFYLDYEAWYKLFGEIASKEELLRTEIEQSGNAIYEPDRVKKLRRNKDGILYATDRKVLEKNKYKVIDKDQVLLYKEIPFRCRSKKAVLLSCEKAGWRPTDFTKKGNPRLSEENLATLPDSAPQILKKYTEWYMLDRRISVLNEWRTAEEHYGDSRIHGGVRTVAASTHRSIHSNPNTGNIASPKSVYGKELRSLWAVPKGCKLLGTDAAGVQLRMLAHYINDPEYTKGVLGDPHTMHQNILGLDKRSTAKTWIYAWIFQAGHEKLGEILGGTAKDGQAAVELFMKRIPGLAKLREQAKQAAKKGYILGLDGRRITVTSVRECMPAWLQGGEAVLMKKAHKLWYTNARKRGYEFEQVGYIHDEWQVEINDNLIEDRKVLSFTSEEEMEAHEHNDGRIWSAARQISDTEYEYVYCPLGELQVKALRRAGELLNLNCPMDGEYMVGDNWYETH